MFSIERIEMYVQIGTLLVSILVFLFTAYNTENQRRINIQSELISDLLKHFSELSKKVDPQFFWDHFQTIVSFDNLLNNKLLYEKEINKINSIYTELSKFKSEINFLASYTVIFIPQHKKLSFAIENLVENIKDNSKRMIELFCKEYDKLYNNKRISNTETIKNEIEKYQKQYNYQLDLITNVIKLLKQSLYSNTTVDRKKINNIFDEINAIDKE